MDVVYFGSGAFGIPTLRALAAAHALRGIVTQPDRPAGRGGALTPTPVGAWAAQHAPGVRVFKPAQVNEPGVAAEIRALNAGAWVVIAFGQKLGARLLDGVFSCNLHASLLPRWRGAAPINAAILAGDAETGNSVITLADRMDAGAILARSRRAIDPMQTAGELHDRLAEDGPALVLSVLSDASSGSLAPEAQDETLVTLAPKLSKDDGWIDFAASAAECQRRVHGLWPWPGVTVSLVEAEGPRVELKLARVRPEPESGRAPAPAEPGTVIDEHQGLVACGGGGALRILEVQPAGKRCMSWADFARGRRSAGTMSLMGRRHG